jgi:hypothetical protein
VRDYRRLLTREQLAAMMPIGSHAAGAARGLHIAYTIPGAARPVLYDMLEASRTNRAGAVMLCGTLGAGKTMALQLLLYQAILRGIRAVDIDPRPDHSLERLPGIEHLVRVISLANLEQNRGRLDPLVVAPPELREELASSYMMEVLPEAKHEWQTEIIDAVRAELREDRPCSWGVVERLLVSEDEHARSAGKALKVWSEWGLGKLAFGRGERPLTEDDLPATTIKCSALTLPPAGTERHNYDQAERISVATMKLITADAMRQLSDRSMPAVLALDEAHVFTATSDGRRFLERLIRMGRSMNITVVLASQLAGDLAELEELIGVRFSFRQETDEQARANIRMHGTRRDQRAARLDAAQLHRGPLPHARPRRARGRREVRRRRPRLPAGRRHQPDDDRHDRAGASGSHVSRRSTVLALGLALILILLPATLAGADYRGTDMWSNLAPPGGAGGLADKYPLSYYQLDYFVDGPSVGFSGVSTGDIPGLVGQFLISIGFAGLTFLMRVTISAFDWAFNIDVIGGRNGALRPGGPGHAAPLVLDLRSAADHRRAVARRLVRLQDPRPPLRRGRRRADPSSLSGCGRPGDHLQRRRHDRPGVLADERVLVRRSSPEAATAARTYRTACSTPSSTSRGSCSSSAA